MAVARLVSLFESKTPDRTSHPDTDPNINIDSFAARSLRLSPTMDSSEEDTFCISIQPYHFSSKRASRQRYYAASNSSSTSSPDASPSSSYRSNRFSFRSTSPIPYPRFHMPTRRSSQHLGLRRIPSHVDLALAAERDEQGLDLLEPRPVATIEAACFGRSASPPVVLENIFEVLEGH